MNLNEQIEAAWEEYKPVFYSDVEYSGISMLEASEESFAEGYRAALRSLYVEIQPEDLVNGKTYWCLVFSDYLDRETWIEMSFHGNSWWYDFEGFGFEADEVKRIVERASLPSPSEVFGEEGG